MLEPYFINFVPSSEPPVSEVVKPSVSEAAKSVKVTPPKKIMVDLKESKSKKFTLSKDKTQDKSAWVCHFCGKSGHIRPNCYKLLREQTNQKYLCLKHKILWCLLVNW